MKKIPKYFTAFLKNLPHFIGYSTSRTMLLPQTWGRTTIEEATQTQFLTYISEFHNAFSLLIKD